MTAQTPATQAESQPRYTIGRRIGGQYYVFDTVEKRIKGDRNTRALAEALIERLERRDAERGRSEANRDALNEAHARYDAMCDVCRTFPKDREASALRDAWRDRLATAMWDCAGV